MKLGNVVSLREYKAQRLVGAHLAGATGLKPLPDAVHLWELLDRNISIEVWKERTR